MGAGGAGSSGRLSGARRDLPVDFEVGEAEAEAEYGVESMSAGEGGRDAEAAGDDGEPVGVEVRVREPLDCEAEPLDSEPVRLFFFPRLRRTGMKPVSSSVTSLAELAEEASEPADSLVARFFLGGQFPKRGRLASGRRGLPKTIAFSSSFSRSKLAMRSKSNFTSTASGAAILTCEVNLRRARDRAKK